MLLERVIQKKEDFIEKLVDVRRTAKVVKGGRIFSFSVLIVVGNGLGQVGFGLGKAREIPLAIQKASYKARRNFFSVDLHKGTLYYPIVSTHCSTKVIMLPAFEGTGIIAGAGSRAVFESVGIKNIISKCIGSHCASNVVLATIKGLQAVCSPKYFFLKRGYNTLGKVYFKS